MVTEAAKQKAQARVEAFIVRARRIEAHSLFGDRPNLMSLARVRMDFKITEAPDGSQTVRMRQEFPPEEQVESLAARVRPLMLSDLNFRAVLNAVGLLSKDAPDPLVKTHLDAIRTMWNKLMLDNEALSGYSVSVGSTDQPDFSQSLTDTALAKAWIYGDVVHADPDRLAASAEFGVAERFRAAVGLVARVAVCASQLLEVVNALIKAGVLRVNEIVLTEPVVVTETVWEQEGKMFLAPVGTPMPSGLSALGDEWSGLGETEQSDS